MTLLLHQPAHRIVSISRPALKALAFTALGILALAIGYALLLFSAVVAPFVFNPLHGILLGFMFLAGGLLLLGSRGMELSFELGLILLAFTFLSPFVHLFDRGADNAIAVVAMAPLLFSLAADAMRKLWAPKA